MSTFVIMTSPGKEAEARSILTRFGYDVTLPVERIWRRFGAGGQRKLKELVLTPRYLFIHHANFRAHIYMMRSLYCRQGQSIISGYLAYSDGEPKPLDRILVDQLVSIGHNAESASYRKSLKPGDQVNTSQGFSGRIIGTKGSRASVLVEALGKIHVVQVNVNTLEAA